MTTGSSDPGPQPVRPCVNLSNVNGTGPQVEGEHPRMAPGARLDVPLTPAESSEEARGGEVIEI